MQNPHIINKITTLIESINWDSFPPDKKFSRIKDILLSHERDSVWPFANPDATYTIIQLLLHILDHPEWQLEDAVLEQFSLLPIKLRRLVRQRSRFEWLRTHRLLWQALPRFKSYLTHRNARYRAYAAETLVCYTSRSDEIIDCQVVQIQPERSPRVIYHILYALLWLFSQHRRRWMASAEARKAVVQCANSLLHAKQPWIRHAAATLIIKLLQRQTPEYVTDVLISSWPHLRNTDWDQYHMIDEPFTGHINGLGMERAFDVCVQLMRLAPTRRAAAIAWDTIFCGSLTYWLGWQKLIGSRIALTHRQKTFMEAVLACRIFWEWKKHGASYLKDQGFQVVRAKLRHQIKHAQIVDTIDKGPNWRQFPLRIKPELLRSKN